MPTDTFFRLPEEKRTRILEGAWSEFTAVPYAEASINRIVQTSRIPRGSFYQYFEDKNDLFLTLIDEIRDQFLDLFHDTLERSGGDLFSMPLVLLDAMVAPSGCITPAFSRAFALLSLNVNMDVQQLFFERAAGELCPQKLLEHIDPTLLRTQEDGFVDDVFTLLVGALACAIARTASRSLSPLRLQLSMLTRAMGRAPARNRASIMAATTLMACRACSGPFFKSSTTTGSSWPFMSRSP